MTADREHTNRLARGVRLAARLRAYMTRTGSDTLRAPPPECSLWDVPRTVRLAEAGMFGDDQMTDFEEMLAFREAEGPQR